MGSPSPPGQPGARANADAEQSAARAVRAMQRELGGEYQHDGVADAARPATPRLGLRRNTQPAKSRPRPPGPQASGGDAGDAVSPGGPNGEPRALGERPSQPRRDRTSLALPNTALLADIRTAPSQRSLLADATFSYQEHRRRQRSVRVDAMRDGGHTVSLSFSKPDRALRTGQDTQGGTYE